MPEGQPGNHVQTYACRQTGGKRGENRDRRSNSHMQTETLTFLQVAVSFVAKCRRFLDASGRDTDSCVVEKTQNVRQYQDIQRLQ